MSYTPGPALPVCAVISNSLVTGFPKIKKDFFKNWGGDKPEDSIEYLNIYFLTALPLGAGKRDSYK